MDVTAEGERGVAPSLRFPEEIAEHWDFGEELDQLRVGRHKRDYVEVVLVSDHRYGGGEP